MKDFILGFLTAQFILFAWSMWRTLRSRKKALNDFENVMEKVFRDAEALDERVKAMGTHGQPPKVDA